MFNPSVPDGCDGDGNQRRIFADQPRHGLHPNQAEEVVNRADGGVVKVQEHQRGGCADTGMRIQKMDAENGNFWQPQVAQRRQEQRASKITVGTV